MLVSVENDDSSRCLEWEGYVFQPSPPHILRGFRANADLFGARLGSLPWIIFIGVHIYVLLDHDRPHLRDAGNTFLLDAFLAASYLTHSLTYLLTYLLIPRRPVPRYQDWIWIYIFDIGADGTVPAGRSLSNLQREDSSLALVLSLGVIS